MQYKKPILQEADWQTIYKCDGGVEPGTTGKQLQVITIRDGLDTRTSGFQVQRPNHSAKLLPKGLPKKHATKNLVLQKWPSIVYLHQASKTLFEDMKGDYGPFHRSCYCRAKLAPLLSFN